MLIQFNIPAGSIRPGPCQIQSVTIAGNRRKFVRFEKVTEHAGEGADIVWLCEKIHSAKLTQLVDIAVN